MIAKSRIVRGPIAGTPLSLPAASPRLSTRRDAREFHAAALATRIVDDARRERAEEETAFSALLDARKKTAADAARLEATTEIVGLAGIVAERLVGALAETQQDLVVRLARDVIREARSASLPVVSVSPASAPVVQKALANGSLDGALSVREDASLAAGDVVLTLDHGRVDGRVSVRVEALVRVLARHWQREAE